MQSLGRETVRRRREGFSRLQDFMCDDRGNAESFPGYAELLGSLTGRIIAAGSRQRRKNGSE